MTASSFAKSADPTGGMLLSQLRTSGTHVDGGPIKQSDVEEATEMLGNQVGRKGIGEGNLTNYEAGGQRPSIENLNLLIDALILLRAEEITADDIQSLFRAYELDLYKCLPRELEKKWAIEQTSEHLKSHQHPAYLLDNSLTILYANNHFLTLAGVAKNSAKKKHLFSMPLYRALYDDKLRLADRMENPDSFLPVACAVLRYELARSGNASWFEFDDLLEKEGEFRRHWELSLVNRIAPTQSFVPMVTLWDDGSKVAYRVFAEPVHNDDRFRVLQYLPVI